MKVYTLISHMIEYYKNSPLTEHALSVYGYSIGIGNNENLGENDFFILECASVLHDIGIPEAIKNHGSAKGEYQEKEGGLLVPTFMEKIGITDENTVNKVTWLVANHHSHEKAKDCHLLQILMEADYLVNLSKTDNSEGKIEKIRDEFFKTKTGIDYMNHMYSLRK